MKIINLDKKCNKKARKVSQKKASPKSDEPKKVSGPIMIQAKKNRSLKKSMEKRQLQRQGKKLKRPHRLKKHQSHLNLLTQARSLKNDHLKI